LNNGKVLEEYIYTKVQGKQRPRVTKHGTYTPKQTVQSEKLIREFIAKRMDKDKLSAITKPGAVDLDIIFVREVPKHFSKKNRTLALNGDLVPIRKPDMDNQEKTVLDALNGLAYDDDSQIVSKTTSKIYGFENAVIISINRHPTDGV